VTVSNTNGQKPIYKHKCATHILQAHAATAWQRESRI